MAIYSNRNNRGPRGPRGPRGRPGRDNAQTSGGGGGGGSVAWGDVTGKPSTFPPSSHTHPISQVTDLQTTLDGKAATSHTHAISAVTGLQSALDGKAASSHTHAIADVTGLQSALDGKQAAGSYAAASHTHAISDVTGLQTALDGKANSAHTHAISDVTGLQTALNAVAVKSAVVTFTAAANSRTFTVTDTDSTTLKNFVGQVSLRADTFDNPGDDCDSIVITGLCNSGNVRICVTHADPKQKLIGTFKINYSTA